MKYQFSQKIDSLQPSAIREILKATADPSVISFAAGNPAPEAFPVETVQKIAAEILQENPVLALQYSVTEGYTPLRDRLAVHVKERYGIGQDFDQVLVVSGAQQGICLTAHCLWTTATPSSAKAPALSDLSTPSVPSARSWWAWRWTMTASTSKSSRRR